MEWICIKHLSKQYHENYVSTFKISMSWIFFSANIGNVWYSNPDHQLKIILMYP